MTNSTKKTSQWFLMRWNYKTDLCKSRSQNWLFTSGRRRVSRLRYMSRTSLRTCSRIQSSLVPERRKTLFPKLSNTSSIRLGVGRSIFFLLVACNLFNWGRAYEENGKWCHNFHLPEIKCSCYSSERKLDFDSKALKNERSTQILRSSKKKLWSLPASCCQDVNHR